MTLLAAACGARTDDPEPKAAPDRARVEAALRQAVEFYRSAVSTSGGYHFYYSADLSYGRSEQAEGPTQVTVQRAGTPLVGMAFLDVYEATADDFYLKAAQAAAEALVQGQHCTGGWDYIIEFDPAKRPPYGYRSDSGCASPPRPEREPFTTLDDNVTQAALRLLMRVDRELDFSHEAIHGAALFALDRLMRAQYPNGAWPQRYFEFPDPAKFPVRKASYPESWSREWPGSNYRDYYTLNDNSQADMIDAMLEAARIYDSAQYLAAAEKGGDFLLLAQMPEPQPGWAQQYDREMHPAWARLFEPPSVTGGEAASVMRILLTLYRETGKEKYLEPLPRALEYYRRSVLALKEDAPARRLRTCPPPAPCLARFNELQTNRPLYITKGTMVRVPEEGTFRNDGYEVTYDDSSTITHYSMWSNAAFIEQVAAELEEIRGKELSEIRRPDRLHGLSPWSGREEAEAPNAGKILKILQRMDDRGAWTQEGTIGRADRVVSVFAAEDMVITFGGERHVLKQDETLDLYRGTEPPREQVIESQTFAENIRALGRYLGAETGR